MSKKDISIKGVSARTEAFNGMDYVADAVESSMGPFGLNFLLEKGDKITNDGKIISTALSLSIDNVFQRRGAILGHKASVKAEEIAKDGSSATWSLQRAIAKEAIRYLPNDKSITSKKTQAEMIKMIDEGKQLVIDELSKDISPIVSKEELIKSALVSVEDEHIANLLGNMQWDLGPEGIIIAEEVNDVISSIEKVNGIRLDNGFGSSQVINNPEKQSLEVSDTAVLMTNYTIGKEEMMKLKELIFVHLINRKQNNLVLIARAFTSEAIQLCMESIKAGFNIYPVNAPYVNQTEIMKDIEAVVGGRYIDVEGGSLDDIYITDIGYAKRLIAEYMSGTITGVDDEKSRERIQKRVERLKLALEGEKSDFSRDILKSRIAQLTDGFAILKVGSHSISNRKRLKDKCDDAVGAVRFALRDGTVKGAGLALKEVSDRLPEDNILKRPICRINEVIMASAPEDYIVPEWVRDPYFVIKTALEQACDSAKVFATINGIVTTANDPDCNCGTRQVIEE